MAADDCTIELDSLDKSDLDPEIAVLLFEAELNEDSCDDEDLTVLFAHMDSSGNNIPTIIKQLEGYRICYGNK